MIKFNHESSNLPEAIGISKEEMFKELKAVTKGFVENDKYIPTDKQKVTILAVAMSDDGTRETLQLFIPFISVDELDLKSNSRLIEYLYKYLDNAAYVHILTDAFKGMLYPVVGDLQ